MCDFHGQHNHGSGRDEFIVDTPPVRQFIAEVKREKLAAWVAASAST